MENDTTPLYLAKLAAVCKFGFDSEKTANEQVSDIINTLTQKGKNLLDTANREGSELYDKAKAYLQAAHARRNPRELALLGAGGGALAGGLGNVALRKLLSTGKRMDRDPLSDFILGGTIGAGLGGSAGYLYGNQGINERPVVVKTKDGIKKLYPQQIEVLNKLDAATNGASAADHAIRKVTEIDGLSDGAITTGITGTGAALATYKSPLGNDIRDSLKVFGSSIDDPDGALRQRAKNLGNDPNPNLKSFNRKLNSLSKPYIGNAKGKDAAAYRQALLESLKKGTPSTPKNFSASNVAADTDVLLKALRHDHLMRAAKQTGKAGLIGASAWQALSTPVNAHRNMKLRSQLGKLRELNNA